MERGGLQGLECLICNAGLFLILQSNEIRRKLVGRLPLEELMAQIPSFLPALFDAFGNHSADVRKMVVSFPVDIYIVLGKALLPYLGSLSSTQPRLVTIHANRISQARSGVVVDMQNVEAMTGHINCIKPNSTTFACILHACPKTGASEQGYAHKVFVERFLETFKEMQLAGVSQTRQPLRASSLTVANGEVYNRPKTWNKIHGYLDTPPQMISMVLSTRVFIPSHNP
ncbi:hypothetical protein SUGI_0984310 [Cryptomeria japonica]|nr:hypothetical protein SUGI_0984310 [Cryptomeria japonica]